MLISNFNFGSFLTYCPRKDDCANGEEIKKSRNIMYNLKNERIFGNPPKFMSELVSEKIKEHSNKLPFSDFFGEKVSLVPVPKSSLMKTDSLWVSDKIARALANQGLGIHYPCLRRFMAVPKSSTSKSNERPKAIDHFNSIRINPLIHQPSEIVLVDDVITRGSTMLGCASVLRRQFPNISIRGFAVIRTISNSADFNSITDPCVGEVTLSNGETYRNP